MYIVNFTEVHKKLEVFRAYYEKLTHLDFKRLYPRLLTAGIISSEDNRNAQNEQCSQATSRVLDIIFTSLEVDIGNLFDILLSIMKNSDDIVFKTVAERMIKDLVKDPNGNHIICIVILCKLVMCPKCIDTTEEQVRHPEENAGH